LQICFSNVSVRGIVSANGKHGITQVFYTITGHAGQAGVRVRAHPLQPAESGTQGSDSDLWMAI
jgi:hypothetical protein